MEASLRPELLRVLQLQLVYSQPPAIHQLPLKYFSKLSSEAPAQPSFSIFTCLFHFPEGILHCELSFLMNLGRVVALHLFIFFSCENGSNRFQSFYISELKPEVLLLMF